MPPKPPMRCAIGGRTGLRVRPASERIGATVGSSARRSASCRASLVPPRIRMRNGLGIDSISRAHPDADALAHAHRRRRRRARRSLSCRSAASRASPLHHRRRAPPCFDRKSRGRDAGLALTLRERHRTDFGAARARHMRPRLGRSLSLWRRLGARGACASRKK